MIILNLAICYLLIGVAIACKDAKMIVESMEETVERAKFEMEFMEILTIVLSILFIVMVNPIVSAMLIMMKIKFKMGLK